MFAGVLRIREVYISDPGSDFFHPKSRINGQKDFRSRIRVRIEEFKYFQPN